MLWIGGQVTASNIITKIFLPSAVCLLVPLTIVSFTIKGYIEKPFLKKEEVLPIKKKEQVLIFSTGITMLLFVPVFKTATHLPPFMGILFGLSVMWILTEMLHKNKEEKHKKSLSISGVLQKIDTPSILFFLGILIAVCCLQSAGHLTDMAQLLDTNLDNIYLVNTSIGVLSSIVDNVPLVAGTMGMYSLETYPPDDTFWELLTYCAGTGGSILIIGSAAGVAVMGILKVDFMWYVKHISWLAFLGYASGIICFILLN
jgi:Na+/H+ antiporter NhaD/arsenite permease-like protein